VHSDLANQLHFQTLLLNQVRNAIVVVDENERITFWNKHAEALYQWTAEEALGKKVNELLHPPGHTVMRPHVRESLKERGYWEGETIVHKKDGTVFTVFLILSEIHAPDGKIIGRAGVNIDISEMRVVEAQLLQKTNQLQTITDAMGSFLEHGNAREASRILLRGALQESRSSYGFVGILAEGPVLQVLVHEGMVWSANVNHDFYEDAIRTYERVGHLEFRNFKNLFGMVVTTGRPVLSNDCKNDPRSGGIPAGHPPLDSFLGVPAVNKGQVIGMIGVANRPGGYTELEQQQLQILAQTAGVLFDSYRQRQQHEKLEAELRQSQKLEAIGRLAGGIAHDFNNVLTVIQGYGQLLSLEQDLPEQIRLPLSGIRTAADRARDLTHQLLAFSRRQVLQPQVFNLNNLMKDVEPMIRRLIGEDIDLKFGYGAEAAMIRADKGQIQQVLMNLCLNARDAMPEGGTLTIRSATSELTGSELRSHPHLSQGSYVCMRVSDTGSGIEAAVLPHIFEPFFTTKEPGRGTGLGLSTVYGIVEQSDGAVDVVSEPGRGATFIVYLPVVHESATPEPVEPQPAKVLSDVTILLVEDDELVRRVTSCTLANNGYRVLEAVDGTEALGVCLKFSGPIDLVLSDVIMPGLSGPETAAQLRRIRPGLRTLFMSGYMGEKIVRRGIQESHFAFIEKPFTPQSLLQKIREVLI
jgi:PAS domain S-box-containing protein